MGERRLRVVIEDGSSGSGSSKVPEAFLLVARGVASEGPSTAEFTDCDRRRIDLVLDALAGDDKRLMMSERGSAGWARVSDGNGAVDGNGILVDCGSISASQDASGGATR